IRDAIDGAAEVRDPIHGLVERAAQNRGVVFEIEVLDRLRKLREDDYPAFERLRAELKDAKVRVSTLDEKLVGENVADGGEKEKQADVLVRIAHEQAELFHSPDSSAHADVKVCERRETWPVRSKGFKRWLIHSYFLQNKSAPNSEALNAALNTIEASAIY